MQNSDPNGAQERAIIHVHGQDPHRRLLGVGVSGLSHAGQSTMFEPQGAEVDTMLDDIQARFGVDVIVRGSLVDRSKKPGSPRCPSLKIPGTGGSS